MRDAISFIHGNNDVDSIIDVIKLWLSASKFTSTVNKSENTVEIRIQHNLGQKCSLYMGTLITMIFADLNMKPEKSMLKDHSLILTFKIPLSRKYIPSRLLYYMHRINSTKYNCCIYNFITIHNRKWVKLFKRNSNHL